MQATKAEQGSPEQAQCPRSSSEFPEARPPRDRLWLQALACSLLLTLEIYALFFDLGESPARRSEDRPVIATYKSGVNEVRNRAAGTITWSVPGTGLELRRSDALLTMKDSQALIEFTDGAQLSVESDSLVVLEKATASHEQSKIILKLLEGSLSKRKAGSSAVAVDLGGDSGQGLIEDQSGKALFHLSKTENGVDVQVESGTVRLGHRGDTRTIGEFEQAKIKNDGAIEVKIRPVRFSNLSPNTAIRIGRDEESTPIELKWARTASNENAESGRRTRVLISKSATLENAKEIDVDEDNGIAKLEIESDGLYFWRVETPDAAAQSTVASFEVVTRRPPTITNPSDDHSIIVGQPVVIHWEPVTTGTVYVETSADEEFTKPTRIDARQGASGTELRFDTPQNLWWRARNDLGQGIGPSVATEPRKITVKPKPALKAPGKIRSRIKISTSDARQLNAFSRLLAFVLDFLSPRLAFGEEAPQIVASRSRKIHVEIEWEAVEGAEQYRLQIALDQDFKNIVLDRNVRGTVFNHQTLQTENTQRLYFKIAGIDAAASIGPFSDPEKIEIDAMPPIEKPKPAVAAVSAAPARKVEEEKPKKPDIAQPKAPVEKPIVLTEEEREKRARFRFSLMLGAALHSRQFKNDEIRPFTTEGAAFVPAFAGFELRRRFGSISEIPDDPSGMTFALLASVIGEKAEPSTAGIAKESFPISLLRVSMMLEKATFDLYGGAGIYATTSQRFSWSGRHAVNERVIALGLAASFANSPVELSRLHWRGQIAIVGSGAKGLDAGGSLRFYWSGRVRRADHNGFFCEAEGLFRMFDIETSFGGVTKIGYAL